MLVLMGSAMMVACKPSVPRQYIQPGEMEDILYDYYVSQGMAETTTGESNREYYRELVDGLLLHPC